MRRGLTTGCILLMAFGLATSGACGDSGASFVDADVEAEVEAEVGSDPADVPEPDEIFADAADGDTAHGDADALVDAAAPDEDTGPACPPPPRPTATAEPGATMASTRNRLRWKRAGVLVNDLAGALGVPQPCDTPSALSDRLASGLAYSMLGYACDPEIAVELEGSDTPVAWGTGEFVPSANSALHLHRQALGGYEVFETLLLPVTRPVATTAVATERTVMLACIAGVDGAQADSTPLLDAAYDLSDATSELSAVEQASVVDALYRRLLARAPLDAEREVVLTLAVDDDGAPIAVRDFAILVCHTLATSTEFLFY